MKMHDIREKLKTYNCGDCMQCVHVRKIKIEALDAIVFFCKKCLMLLTIPDLECENFRQRPGTPRTLKVNPGVMVRGSFDNFTELSELIQKLEPMPMGCTSCESLKHGCTHWPDYWEMMGSRESIAKTVKPHICPSYYSDGNIYLYYQGADSFEEAKKKQKKLKGLKVQKIKFKSDPNEFNTTTFSIASPTQLVLFTETEAIPKICKKLKLKKNDFEIKTPKYHGDYFSKLCITVPQKAVEKLINDTPLPVPESYFVPSSIL
jgi:hypothetical protein